jgi:hypothetical protein
MLILSGSTAQSIGNITLHNWHSRFFSDLLSKQHPRRLVSVHCLHDHTVRRHRLIPPRFHCLELIKTKFLIMFGFFSVYCCSISVRNGLTDCSEVKPEMRSLPPASNPSSRAHATALAFARML